MTIQRAWKSRLPVSGLDVRDDLAEILSVDVYERSVANVRVVVDDEVDDEEDHRLARLVMDHDAEEVESKSFSVDYLRGVNS